MMKDGKKPRGHCIRCGECCLSSSPSLQMADASLVYDGFIEKRNLYTIRTGEVVRDNIHGELKVTDKEIIKIREKENGQGCFYYDEVAKSCAIYEHRPIQCRALVCWDETEFMRVYARPKLDRRDVIRDKNLVRLIDEQGRKCSYLEFDRCVRRIEEEGETAVQRLLGLLRFDHDLRALTLQKLHTDPDDMDLIFGRSLKETISAFGLIVRDEPDGSFFLTILDSAPA